MDSIRSELNSLIVGEFRSRKSASAGLFAILNNIFLAILAATLAIICPYFFNINELTANLIAILFIGTRWRALGNMMHECSHGIFVDNHRKNLFFGHLISAFELSSFGNYTEQHMSHHAYLGHPDQDLDFRSRRVLLSSTHNQKSRFAYLIIAAVTLIPLWLIILRPVVWNKTCPFWVNILRLSLIIIAIALLIHPFTQNFAMLYLILPYLTTYQWMKVFSDASDHMFLYTHTDSLDRSRNHILNLNVLNWLFYPRNDGYHLLHHLFPSMPTHHYPSAHKRLLQHPWYQSKEHFLNFSLNHLKYAFRKFQGHKR